MTYLLDTNIIIHSTRNDSTALRIENQYNLFSSSHRLVVSVVTVGELYSFALQRNWGIRRMEALGNLLSLLLIVDINSPEIIRMYAEIDSYS